MGAGTLTPPAPASETPPRPPVRRARPARIDGFDLLLLGMLAVLSLWVIGLDLWQAAVHHLVWTGSETVYPEDGFQSMMWIRGISEHGASPDLWVLGRTSADLFQPLLAISGALTALGVAPYVALLIWKPVAVLGAFAATRAFVRRAIDGLWARRAALTLALFFGWGTIIGDSWIPWWTWGYPFALIGLACALGALLSYARDRAAGRIGVLPALLGAGASWLHPWQGEILILILVGCELGSLRRGGPARELWRLALTVLASAMPLAYFAALVHFDPVWQHERESALFTYPISHIVSCFWPLALPALLAYRCPPRDFIALSIRVWPFAAAAVFGFSEWKGSGSTHALLGITIPLAVLAVEGVRSLSWQRLRAPMRAPALGATLSVALIALFTVPADVTMLAAAKASVRPKPGNANFIKPDENRALSFLARDPAGGGVLTRFYLGMVVPARTGRNSYVGDCFWSEPHCRRRSRLSEALLMGALAPPAARAFVRSTHARFVLGDCSSHALAGLLAPLIVQVRRFGCATVYVLGRTVAGAPG